MTDGTSPVPSGEKTLNQLLAAMSPALDSTRWAFCAAPKTPRPDGLEILMEFRESEGVSWILESGAADRAGLTPRLLARRIVLQVHSDLEAVGFLAAVSTALAAAGIPCNAVAALRHDHLFVPEADAERAMQVLRAVESRAREGAPAVVYTVRVTLGTADEAEWVSWMEREHIPAVLATGCFLRCDVARETEPEPVEDEVTFVLDYLAPSMEACERYRTEFAPALRQASTDRFGGRFTATRSLRVRRASLS
jgi:hypothetical protein